MTTKRVIPLLGLLPVTLFCAAALQEHEQDNLLAELPKAKHSLAQGIQQLSQGTEEAISAKFEMEEGHLSLSVYTAEKGLGTCAERNVLKEFAGKPDADAWKPEAEVFNDVPHVSRASTQLTLMSLTKLSLLRVLEKTQADQAGTVYSITPVLRDRRPVFVLLVAKDGKSSELVYDLMSGERVKK